MSRTALEQLIEKIIHMEYGDAQTLTEKCISEGMSATEILNGALIPALDRVGALFQDGEYFLPDVLMSVKAYEYSYNLLEKKLIESNHPSRGVIMLGTVSGDIHDIGKNIVAALLKGNGFTIIDLGVNVSAEDFLKKAKEKHPDIIGLSSLLTTTMPAMKETIDLFTESGIRNFYKIIVGGSPLSQRFADEIGADGYGEDAASAITLVKRLIG